jgi:transketolase
LGRFQAAGWDAVRIDGHDTDAIEAAIAAARETDKPSLIACKTTIGYGSPNKQGTSGVHGAPLGDEEIALTRDALGWSAEPFEIPSHVLDAWRLAGRAHASTRKSMERVIAGDLPEGLDEAVDAYKKHLADEKPGWATRKSSEEVLKAIVPHVPEMIGGSADLTGSNNTRTPEQAAVSADNYGGQFIHWGIREHGMAAAMNGMTLHGGFIPYSGTFLVFSDYSRPAIRLSALMKQRTIHVLTHDSIGLGEDGPTHQPVEHLSALRVIPNTFVFRPADAIETLECWQLALKLDTAPSVLALTRQGLPTVRTYEERNVCAHGAYELAAGGKDPQVTLMASGSEISVAMEARATLEAEGIGARVVSVPCMELFEQQSAATKADVLGDTPVRIAVEAAMQMSWDRYLRPQDIFIGMDDFGASAPAPQLFQHFGITADAVCAAARDALA